MRSPEIRLPSVSYFSPLKVAVTKQQQQRTQKLSGDRNLTGSGSWSQPLPPWPHHREPAPSAPHPLTRAEQLPREGEAGRNARWTELPHRRPGAPGLYQSSDGVSRRKQETTRRRAHRPHEFIQAQSLQIPVSRPSSVFDCAGYIPAGNSESIKHAHKTKVRFLTEP